MLQQMRKSTGSWIAKGILGLLVLSFLGWGVSSYSGLGGSGDGNTVAKVGDRDISFTEFYIAYQRFIQNQRLTSIDSDVAKQLHLADNVLQNMTLRTLYEAEADRKDLTASDEMVRTEIQSRPTFQGTDGKFDRLRFETALQQNGLTEPAMVEQVRHEIARSQLLGAVTAGSAAPEALVDRIYHFFGERRSAEYLTLPIASVDAPSDPDDATLQAFYDERKEDFRRPELRGLTYVLISPEAIASTMDISEGDIKASYEARLGELGQPEQRDIGQILFNSEEDAKAASEALAAVPVADLKAKVEEMGLQLIELGKFSRQAIPNESLAEATFSLEKPGVTGAFEGAFGWSVAVVNSITEGSEPSLDEVRDQITRDLALDRAYDAVFDYGKKLEDAFAQGMTLEEAGTSIGIEAQKIDAVDANGRGPDGKPLADLPAGLTFLQKAFAQDLKAGDVGFLETTESNAMFMLRVDNITPAAIPDFATVKDEVKAAWVKDAQYKAAETRAQTLAAQLGAQGDISLIATTLGVEPSKIENFSRNGQASGGARIPDALASELFGLEVGKGAYAVQDDAFVIARLTKITPADTAAETDFRKNIVDALSVGMSNDLVEQLGVALQKEIKTTTYPEVIDRVYR
ncbi:MAG: SurA N-terminal domain-containing protein [Alphaproteobacteria bacterium]|nr:SurA N-terminal domain-containing protein [Alphaproteobacteria bacterium]